MKEIVIDRRATGALKIIEIDSKKTLHFIDHSDSVTTWHRQFNDQAAFLAYLKTVSHVDTWEIEVPQENKTIYFHSEPLSGDLEQFNSEKKLNYVLSLEGDGEWVVKKSGADYYNFAQRFSYFLDSSDYWHRSYTIFNNYDEFEKITNVRNTNLAEWNQKIYLIFLLILLNNLPVSNAQKIAEEEPGFVHVMQNNNFNFGGDSTILMAPDQNIALFTINHGLSLTSSGTLLSASTYIIPPPYTDNGLFFSSGVVASNGNILLTGSTNYGAFFARLDISGTITSLYQYEINNRTLFSMSAANINILSDNSIFIGGRISPTADVASIYCMKIANDNSLLWALSGTSINNVAGVMSSGAMADGGIVITAVESFSDFGGDNILLTRLASNGTTLWAKTFKNLLDSATLAISPLDSSILLLCPTTTTHLLMKFAPDGTGLWTNFFSVSYTKAAYIPAFPTFFRNGDFIITGSSPGYYFVQRWANNGTNIQWTTVLSDVNLKDFFTAAFITPDENVLVTEPLINHGIMVALLPGDSGTISNCNAINSAQASFYRENGVNDSVVSLTLQPLQLASQDILSLISIESNTQDWKSTDSCKTATSSSSTHNQNNLLWILIGTIGGTLFLIGVSVAGYAIYRFKRNKDMQNRGVHHPQITQNQEEAETQSLLDSFKSASRSSHHTIPTDYLQQAQHFFSEENYKQVIKLCTQELKYNSRSHTAYEMRAIAYYKLQRYSKATADFHEVIKLNRENYDAYYYLGEIYENGNDVNEDIVLAITYYKTAANNGNNAAQEKLNKYPPNFLELINKAEKGDAESQFSLGEIFRTGTTFSQKNYKIALEWFTKASKQNHVAAQYALGWMYERGVGDLEKDIKRAMTFYQSAAKLDKNNAMSNYLKTLKSPLAYRTRAQYCNEIGQYAKAIEDCNKALKINPSDAIAFWLRAIAHLGLKELEKTISDCTQTLTLDPKNEFGYHKIAYQTRAEAYRVLKQYDQAIADSTTIINLYNDINGFHTRAEIYLILRKYKEAVADFESILASNSKDPDALYRLGQLYEVGKGVKRDIHAAIYYYEQAVAQKHSAAKEELSKYSNEILALIKKAEKGDPESQFLLGEKYQAGKSSIPRSDHDALLWYQKAADKDYSNAQFNVGWFYEMGWGGLEKNIEEAKLWYQKAASRGHTAASNRLSSFSNVNLTHPLQLNNSPKEADLPSAFDINYETLTLGEMIGKGGFGTVYKAKYANTTVAVKKLDENFSTNMESKFRAEMAIMAKLHHENIVRLYGFFLKPTAGIVMKYMIMGSLFKVLHDQTIKLNYETLIKIAKQIAYGINFLHEKNILHRDLKSANVLLGDDFHAVLADFGLAQFRSNEEDLNNNNKGKVVGTYEWMAPEILNAKEYIDKADIYSFGVILWELVTRQRPLQTAHGDRNLIKQKVCNGERDAIPSNAPLKFSQLIILCWSREPTVRPKAEETVKFLQTEEFTTEISSYRDNFFSN